MRSLNQTIWENLLTNLAIVLSCSIELSIMHSDSLALPMNSTGRAATLRKISRPKTQAQLAFGYALHISIIAAILLYAVPTLAT